MSRAQIEKKVENYLGNSQLLADQRRQPITSADLQAEIDRMASHTKQPDVLRELFAALNNDPFVIAECLARPILAERLVNELTVVAGVSQAQLIAGTGCVGSAGVCTGNVSVSGAVVTVPLTNIINDQNIIVRIFGVNGVADTPATDFDLHMGILIGDTNGNGTVNAADVAQTKSRLGQTVDATNFRSDVNANGSINAADTAIVKQNSGTSLPP
jgi:hypothetical protein